MITKRIRRWVAVLVLSALAFGQGSLAIAACAMERGMMGGAMAMAADEGCEEMARSSALESINQCFAHCTADLQQVAEVGAMVPHAAAEPVLVVPMAAGPGAALKELVAPPPGAPPRRILLHSFLI